MFHEREVVPEFMEINEEDHPNANIDCNGDDVKDEDDILEDEDEDEDEDALLKQGGGATTTSGNGDTHNAGEDTVLSYFFIFILKRCGYVSYVLLTIKILQFENKKTKKNRVKKIRQKFNIRQQTKQEYVKHPWATKITIRKRMVTVVLKSITKPLATRV